MEATRWIDADAHRVVVKRFSSTRNENYAAELPWGATGLTNMIPAQQDNRRELGGYSNTVICRQPQARNERADETLDCSKTTGAAAEYVASNFTTSIRSRFTVASDLTFESNHSTVLTCGRLITNCRDLSAASWWPHGKSGDDGWSGHWPEVTVSN